MLVRRMHGNSSCRLCAMESMEVVLGEGCSLFSFDFSGSGQSGGDYVSVLGLLWWPCASDLATLIAGVIGLLREG